MPAFRHQHINPDNWMVPTHIWKNVAPDTCDTLCIMPPNMSATGIQHLQPILLKNERPGRNPKSGESAIIKARQVVSFHPSGKLRKEVVEGRKHAAIALQASGAR